MLQQQHLWRLILVGSLAVGLAFLAACAGGISQSEYGALQRQLALKERELAELKQQPGAGPGVTTLIGAKAVPKPTPAPPPTALPAGVAPPAPRTAPAAYYEPVGPFSFYVETLTSAGATNDGFVASPGCVISGVFKRGTRMVWRFEILDIAASKRLTDRDQPTVKVRLPHGEELTARWAQRGGGRVPDAPWMWVAAWEIPMSYPLGSLDYSITATSKDGRSGTFKTPALVSPDGGSDTRVRIVE